MARHLTAAAWVLAALLAASGVTGCGTPTPHPLASTLPAVSRTGTAAAPVIPSPSLPPSVSLPTVGQVPTVPAEPTPAAVSPVSAAAGGWGPAMLAAAPKPPRLLALPADFTTPEAVAAAYLAAWCYTPVDQAANTNLRNASRWMTAAGWTDDTSRAIDQPTWAQTQAAGVSTVCGPVTATVSSQGPNTDAAKWVAASAMQARTRGGLLIGQSPVTVMRRVLLATVGRWLVDVRVNAG
jgi:hypothetical protein